MIEIEGQYFKLDIKHKNIKNIYLSLNGNTLKVTCPYHVDEKLIRAFINDKSAWIISKYKQSLDRMVNIDEHIYYLGKSYDLIFNQGSNRIQFKDDKLYLYAKDMPGAINYFYVYGEHVLMRYLDEFKDDYFKILKDYNYTKTPEISFHHLKKAWGVCYPNKNKIVLNYKLIHYPVECLEAVFLHECLHFILPNHSKRFHDLLSYHMPEYKKIIGLLKS